MKIRMWAQTKSIGSRVEITIEVDESDFEEGMELWEENDLIDEVVLENLPKLVDWGWNRVEG
jgi:hypothetical protein